MKDSLFCFVNFLVCITREVGLITVLLDAIFIFILLLPKAANSFIRSIAPLIFP